MIRVEAARSVRRARLGVLAVTYAVAGASWFWLERPVLASRWANRTTTPRGKPRATVPEAASAVSAAD